MNFQLVIQFPSETLPFEDFVEVEILLCDAIQLMSDVDGHDYGSGEGNIFVITNNPKDTLARILDVVPSKYKSEMRAAYRPLAGAKYTPVWPPGLTDFKVS